MRLIEFLIGGTVLISRGVEAVPTTDSHALEVRQGDCRANLGCSYAYIEQKPYQWRRDYMQ